MHGTWSRVLHHHTTMTTMLTKAQTHPFNGSLSGTAQESRYQKGKTNLDFTEARDREWQWHQLGHMQSVPRSRQPASHHSSFLPCLPLNQQTVSKHWRQQSCVKQSTVNRLQQSVTSLTATRTHKPCDRITALPATQQRRHSRLYPGKADTPFSDTGGKQGWIDVLGWLHTEMVYPLKDGHPSQY